MKNLQRVVWAKGMLLTPQHFQAHSNYVDDIVQFRFGASNFANWGVTELAIDEEGLASGDFAVTRFQGVLPDGTLIECPATDPAPPRRPFTFATGQDVLDVYLAVPDRVQGQNVSLALESDGSANVRYTARVKDVRDENGFDEDKPVQFAQRNLAILFGNQKMDGYVRLRIAQMQRKPPNLFALNKDFIPPLLSVAANAALMDLIKRQIDVLGQKSQALSSIRRKRGGASESNLSETRAFWLLQTVNSFLPELTHIWTVRRGHPEPLYLALLRLAGALSTLSQDDDVRTLPQYDHDDLGPCFSALEARLRNLLEVALDSKCFPIPLRQKQRIWSGNLVNEWVPSSQMYLAIAAEMGVDDIIRRAPQLLRLAPSDEIEVIVKHALPGLTLRHTAPPGALPFRPENQYFSVNQSGRLWDGIAKSRAISLFIPPEFIGARPELYILLA